MRIINFISIGMSLAALSWLIIKEFKKKDLYYIDTIYVYEDSKIGKNYINELNKVNSKRNAVLDSLMLFIRGNEGDNSKADILNKAKNEFLYKKDKFSEESERLASEYNAKVWQQITEYTIQYGKENNCDFIFGANGQGSLMYAENANDISKSVLSYIDTKFTGE